MSPTISIIIPLYEQADYIEDCLESAYNQTMPAHEIIVVDDGSTDGGGEIAERYRFSQFPGIESPVKVIHQVNKGLPSARNTGIMNATGDYIWFLDADDMLKENAIERMTQEMIKVNADIYAPSFKEFGKSDREVILGGFTMDDLKVANRLGYFSPIRRSALLEIGGYSPRMKAGWEDWHLWFNLFTRGKTVAVIPEILVMYRVKEKSMITEANEHAEELWGQIHRDFNFLWPK